MLGFLAVCVQAHSCKASFGVDPLLDEAFHVLGYRSFLSPALCALLRSVCPSTGTLIPGCSAAPVGLRPDPDPSKVAVFACPNRRLSGTTSTNSGNLAMFCCNVVRNGDSALSQLIINWASVPCLREVNGGELGRYAQVSVEKRLDWHRGKEVKCPGRAVDRRATEENERAQRAA